MMLAGDVVVGDVVTLPDGQRFRVAAVEHVGALTRVLVSVAGRRHHVGALQRLAVVRGSVGARSYLLRKGGRRGT